MKGSDGRISGDLEWVGDLKQMHGASCPFVPSSTPRPDFDVLNDGQKAYYLYFRDSFLRGELIQTDQTYARLLLVELINDRNDPETVLGHLMRYRDSCRGRDYGYPPPSVAGDAVMSYAVANGLDLPRMVVSRDIWRRILLSDVMMPFLEPVGHELIPFLTGEEIDRLDDRALELFNAAAPSVDHVLRETSGRGLSDAYHRRKVTEVVELFGDTGIAEYYTHDRYCILTYIEFEDALRTFLDGFWCYCRRLIAKESGGKGPSVSGSFPKECRRAVDAVYNHGDIVVPLYLSKRERGFTLDEPGRSVNPVVHRIRSDQRAPMFTSTFYTDLMDLRMKQPEGSCRYTSSGGRFPLPGYMIPEAVRYYTYWRDMARDGRYGETDDGYLWLYRCELINSGADDGYVLEQLAGLARAYGEFYEDETVTPLIPGITYVDYAFVRCPLTPDPTVFACPLSVSDMVQMLLEDRDPPVCAVNFLWIAGIGNGAADSRIRDAFTEDCANITGRVISRMNRISAYAGGQITGFCRIKSVEVRADLFHGMYNQRAPTRTSGKRTMLDIQGNVQFRSEMKELVRAVIRAVKDRRLKPVWIYGIEASRIVLEEMKRWFADMRAASAAEKAGSIVLDSVEVERAETDLRRVSALVGVEHDDREEPGDPDPAASRPSGDPWSDLVSRLNKGQREYLRKALEGTLRAAKPTIEGSINGIAMDIVKDAAMEDGRVFEEYVQDLERALRASAERVKHRGMRNDRSTPGLSQGTDRGLQGCKRFSGPVHPFAGGAAMFRQSPER